MLGIINHLDLGLVWPPAHGLFTRTRGTGEGGAVFVSLATRRRDVTTEVVSSEHHEFSVVLAPHVGTTL